jgi:phosphoribosylanthranilate isomerase
MTRRIRVKFCGITRLGDAQDAVALGVDALGFVFYAASPRAIAPSAAAAIIAQLPPFVATVGLFVDAAPEWVESVVRETGIDLVQYHGTETPEACRAGGRPYVKAIRMAAGVDLTAAAAAYGDARALLLDTPHPLLPGGTGSAFDWSLVPVHRTLPFVLAGGLTAANVAVAARQVRPYAVDVSGGIESSKGVKDPAKMRAFMTEVNRIECNTES